MICECNAAPHPNGAWRSGYHRCRNHDAHPAVRGEVPRPPAPGEQTKFRVWAHFLWLAVNDIAVACGHTSHTEWPKGSGKQRLPEPLELARTANDSVLEGVEHDAAGKLAVDRDDMVEAERCAGLAADAFERAREILGQVKPEARHVGRSHRIVSSRRTGNPDPRHRSRRHLPSHRGLHEYWLSAAAAQKWNDEYRWKWLEDRRKQSTRTRGAQPGGHHWGPHFPDGVEL